MQPPADNDDNNDNQPKEEDQPRPGPRIRWLDVRFNGSLVCRVNADDPTHVQVMANVQHGRRRIFEVSTKSFSVTGSGQGI